jgi:hypothetical protein
LNIKAVWIDETPGRFGRLEKRLAFYGFKKLFKHIFLAGSRSRSGRVNTSILPGFLARRQGGFLT